MKKNESKEVQRLYSGLIRLHVLHHAAEEEIFGLGMMRELARHGYRIGPGTMYPMFHALERSGLLTSRPVKHEGRIQRVYRATSAGKRALAEAKEKVQELFEELFES
ncbi:MAG TPA: PadR family transcriptional regulator [Acidobacteriaceae bacterium]|nr:PadR family transcriptional regulator [Acidobacteriaceae bacterium]